jgi:hypothetical protein
MSCVFERRRQSAGQKGKKHMHLAQMRHRLNVQTAGLRTTVILVVGLAGVVQLALVREHFAESFVSGLIFLALALFQLNLALLLALRAGPAVYRVGRWGSGLIVLVYIATRLFPLPEANVPEEIGVIGIVATGLELAAVLLLAVALPAPATLRKPHGRAGAWGVGGAVVFALLWLPLTGVVQWTTTVYATPLYWAGTDSWSALTPILSGSPLPHLWLVAPWWSLPAVAILAILVGLNLWLSTQMRSAGVGKSEERRAGLLTVLPAGIAAPVCCSASPPLLALFGVPLALDAMAAPFAALLSAVLLTFSLVFLRIRFRRALCRPFDDNAASLSLRRGEATAQTEQQ